MSFKCNYKSNYIQSNNILTHFSTQYSWCILSSTEEKIKTKMTSIGVPLKQWDIQINYGIKTGCNEAFIINKLERQNILNNCHSTEELNKTDALIRPILRGRDLKPYGYQFAEMYLIATFPSRHYDIEDYPAIKDYLLSFGRKRLEQTGKTYVEGSVHFKARKKTNNKWYETQDSISYWDLFYQSKICWKAVGRNLAFAVVDAGIFLTAPASFIVAGKYNSYLMLFFSSAVGRYYIYKNSDTTGAGDIMLNIQSLIKFPIPKPNDKILKIADNLLLQRSTNLISDDVIDQFVYKQYNMSKDEIEYIKNH